MFLIAPCRRVWQAGTLPNAKQRRKRKSRNGHFAETFSQKEERHEYDTWIKNGLVHLHRQMDAQDFVFATKQALSPRAVAPPAGEGLATHADQNSPQSRIRRFDRPACDPFEGHYCRVFVDQSGKDNHRSTQRNVPLGKATPEKGNC
jgi:hypothetical protein